MSHATQEETAFLVNVLDRDGYETGRAVLVYLTYEMDVDASYGADADGNRGETRVEYEVLDCYVDKGDQNTLLAEEERQVLADARANFMRRDKHFH